MLKWRLSAETGDVRRWVEQQIAKMEYLLDSKPWPETFDDRQIIAEQNARLAGWLASERLMWRPLERRAPILPDEKEEK